MVQPSQFKQGNPVKYSPNLIDTAEAFNHKIPKGVTLLSHDGNVLLAHTTETGVSVSTVATQTLDAMIERALERGDLRSAMNLVLHHQGRGKHLIMKYQLKL